jgi:hypothetical protein
MGVREIQQEFLKTVDPAVREILSEVLMAEQARIDMKTPQGIKIEIKNIIDAQVKAEERRG